MSDREKEAALAFCKTKPIQWEDFREKWMQEHPEPVVEEPKKRGKKKQEAEE